MQKKEYSCDIDNNKLTVTFSDLAERANGSVLVNHKNTLLLVTAVMTKNPKETEDFLPLSVDYEERFYASGKILGSKYTRREGKPADSSILSGRVVDRTIRPLFDSHLRNQIQVIITALALGEGDVSTLAVLGASLALSTSDIPWNGPVSAVKLQNKGSFELIACGKDGKINMIELAGHEVSETEVTASLLKASVEIEKLQKFQTTIVEEIGREKATIKIPDVTELQALFEKGFLERVHQTLFSGATGEAAIDTLKEEWMRECEETLRTKNIQGAGKIFDDIVNTFLHGEAIDNNRRPDGRDFDEIRPLFAQAGGVSPLLHGSGIFYRGGTHIFSALTLGGPSDAQTLENSDQAKRFMHHYNFPPFGVGQTGKADSVNRRMIGHGALAEKALVPILPSQDIFPYTIRIVSEAFASNGSTSMGSVCASTLALMDAGVPIKAPVAGIASGLMMHDEDNYKILTDIQGPEDHYGDMDFKVAGTRSGITAVQMDVKVEGIPLKILTEAFEKAKKARFTILDTIENTISKPRTDVAPSAPYIVSMKIQTNQIGLLIGPGGKTINEIKDKIGVHAIDIEDDGTVLITGKKETARKAEAVINTMLQSHNGR